VCRKGQWIPGPPLCKREWNSSVNVESLCWNILLKSWVAFSVVYNVVVG
jgi:hypothetical protein